MSCPTAPSTDVFDKVTMGIVHYIREKPGVYDVVFAQYENASKDILDSWEEDNNCKLPQDLRNFYRTMNGLLIEWNVELNEEKLSIGRLEVNQLESLISISKDYSKVTCENNISLEDLDIESDPDDDPSVKQRPSFNDKCFELSMDEAYGRVCLVYRDDQSKSSSGKLCNCEIWFLDYSLQWYFLAPCFLLYYRMLITHIGIPGWQYLFTDNELSPESLLWCSMYLSYRLPGKSEAIEHVTAPKESDRNKLDFTTLFKSRSGEKRKTDTSKQVKGTNANKQRGTKTGMTRSSTLKNFSR